MTPERWQQIGELFARALAVPKDERAAWLAALDVPGDLRHEVTKLLDAHESDDGFLESPPPGAEEALPAAAPDPALVAGAMVGPYRLVREIGRGGMGVVFEAEDTRLHRRVALKAVSSAAPDGGDQRLRQEARAAAALVHPNIATVYALDDIDGRAYIASELLDGETLREVLARGSLSRGETLTIAHSLASALETAHAHGIVHRDLKPENVLRLADGRVKILDFGIARLEGDARRLQSSTRLTLQGLIAGTPGYMAPEQLLGEAVDGRADQFALGALLAEMASGTNPFDGGSLAGSIALAMQSDGLPVPLDGSRVAPDIAAIASRCTRHRREDRFPTTADLVAAIDACRRLDAPTAIATAISPSTVRRTVLAAPLNPDTGRRPAIWWWRFHQAAAAAVYWMMVAPAWLVHREIPRGMVWFLGCLAATIIAANVRLHLRFSAAVLPEELPAQRAKTRGWVAIADWAIILLWAYAGAMLMDTSREWAVVFVAFAIGHTVVVGLIEPATTRAAFEEKVERGLLLPLLVVGGSLLSGTDAFSQARPLFTQHERQSREGARPNPLCKPEPYEVRIIYSDVAVFDNREVVHQTSTVARCVGHVSDPTLRLRWDAPSGTTSVFRYRLSGQAFKQFKTLLARADVQGLDWFMSAGFGVGDFKIAITRPAGTQSIEVLSLLPTHFSLVNEPSWSTLSVGPRRWHEGRHVPVSFPTGVETSDL